jgi:predicted PurR-regulated permease PerM
MIEASTTRQPGSPLSAPPAPSSINWRLIGRSVLIAAGIVFVLYVMSLARKTTEVFIIAILLAYGLSPVVRALSKRMPRAVAIIVVYSALIVVSAAVFVLIVPAVLDQFQVVFANAPTYIGDARGFIDSAQLWLKQHLGSLVATNQISQIESTGMSRLTSGIETALGSLSGVVVSIANGIVVAIFGVLLSYFLLANSDAVRDSYYSLFPERLQKQARYFASEVGRVVGGFIVGQTVLCILAAAMTYIGLLIIRSPYALLLAVLSGLCYAIPYIGVVIAAVAGFGLGALTSWQIGLFVAVIIMVASKIADFLVPKVMGDSVGVSPIAIIFAVFAGGELFGLWGLILAIPAAALFKVVWTLWLHPWLTGKPVVIEEAPNAVRAHEVPAMVTATASAAGAAPQP